MFEITVVLVSLTAVCMAVPSMRLWAVLGLGLLLLLYLLTASDFRRNLAAASWKRSEASR